VKCLCRCGRRSQREQPTGRSLASLQCMLDVNRPVMLHLAHSSSPRTLTTSVRLTDSPDYSQPTHATNLRTYELTPAPANRNRAVLLPAELKFLRFKASLNFSTFFYLLCNLRCKSNLISIISRLSATAWQRAIGVRRRRWRL